jgi:exopolysaccharide biosynthesis predicted pyruvyltransferase EpsI
MTMDDESNYATDLRGTRPFDELLSAIRAVSEGRRVDFYPSPGNWGDALINLGSRQFLQSHKIAVRELRRSDASEKDDLGAEARVAIVGGGGGWNRNWYSTIGFVETLQRLYHHVVVLPSSFDHELLAAIDREKVTLFTRADDSGVADVSFCHDMAFFCRVPSLPDQRLGQPLIALRRDKERHADAVDPDRNWDLSLLGTADTDPIEFFGIVNRFLTIFTDRLHIAIAGAMLGRKVLLLDGNYRKNEGVFRASLKPYFSRVELMTWQQFRDRGVSGVRREGEPGYPLSP